MPMGPMEMERAMYLIFEAGDDLADAAKLQLGVSTGAVVLFVHSISDFHRMPVRTGLLTMATFFFGFSAINCIKALVHLSVLKLKAGDSLWRDVAKRGDLFLEKANADISAVQDKFGKMERYFYAGVAWSVLFMVVQFLASFRS